MVQRMDSAVYSIGAVARMLGVSVPTLRSWEERYGLISPERSEGGHRLYSRDHVDRLQFVVKQIEEGMSAGDAHRLLEQSMRRDDGALPTQDRADHPALVLLAERDPFAAELAEYFLRTEGYEVEIALDADSAVAMVVDRRPQVVIVDLLISGGEGLTLCEKLGHRSDVALLAISTLESRDEALTAGAAAFLRKPIDPLQLVSTVKDLSGTSAYLHNRG